MQTGSVRSGRQRGDVQQRCRILSRLAIESNQHRFIHGLFPQASEHQMSEPDQRIIKIQNQQQGLQTVQLQIEAFPVCQFVNEDLPSSHQDWLEGAEQRMGTWWDDWAAWLQQRSGRKVNARTTLGRKGSYEPMEAAPGTYVY